MPAFAETSVNVPSPLLRIEDVGHALEVVGVAVGAVARLLLAAVAVVLEAPLHVARDEQIELAVVVVVEEPGARAPAAGRHAGPRGDVGERAVAVVAVERVAAVARDVEVGEAVVVVVADRHAHAVVVLRHPGQPRLLGDVGERAVGGLPIEPVPDTSGRTCRAVRPAASGRRIFAPLVKNTSSRPSLS